MKFYEDIKDYESYMESSQLEAKSICIKKFMFFT